MVFQAEAEVRWLDHCEASLVRAATERDADAATRAAATSRKEAAR